MHPHERKKRIVIKLPNKKINYWMIVSFLLLGILLLNISGILVFGNVSPKEAGNLAINYINNHLVKPGTSAKLERVRDLGNVYEVDTDYQGKIIPVYVSKNGKLMFLYAFNLSKEQQTSTQTQKPNTNNLNIPKRDVPDVKLFVMSYCPFGLQAEKALLPVMKLLGNKANITVHFVYYCMHGTKEVYENLRQYCIQNYQKDKYYDYLLCFVQTGDYQKCLTEAKIDSNELEKCMNETMRKYNITGYLNDKSKWLSGRFPVFPIDMELNKKYNVRGSPTLVINDKVVEITRSPEAFKKAICSGFNNPPSECNVKLSASPTSPGIGPINSTSTATGTCG